LGKAQILSGGTDGKYFVRILRDLARLNSKISRINSRINTLDNNDIPAATADKLSKKTSMDSALSALNTAIEDSSLDIKQYQINYHDAVIEYQQSNVKLQILRLRKSSLERERESLESEETITEQWAWCTDLTEDLSGEVATIEIPGERDRVLVRPGYDGQANYNQTRDGQLQPVMANTVSAAFYNAAMFPGWQRWKPQYRTGTIDSITDSTCTVTLDRETSSAQGLSVDPDNLVLTDIGFSYMNCDESAFESGDHVVVEFPVRDWETAQVIGFVSDPKACGYRVKVARDDGDVIDTGYDLAFWLRNSAGDWLEQDEDFTATYDLATQYWVIELDDGIPEDGVEIFCTCIDSVWTKYPYKYKYADYSPVDSLQSPGDYEMSVPYWTYSFTYYDPPRIWWNLCDTLSGHTGKYPNPVYYNADYRYFNHFFPVGGSFITGYTQYSSIPYKVNFNLDGDLIAQSWYWESNSSCELCQPANIHVQSDCGTVNEDWDQNGRPGGIVYGTIWFPGLIGGRDHELEITDNEDNCVLSPVTINICIDRGNFGLIPDYD